jgi:hypothetical protein
MLLRLWFICILSVVIAPRALAIQLPSEETRYSEEDAPPATGWESAMKFFSRSPSSSVATSSGGHTEPGDSALFFDQNFFMNSKYLSDGVERPKFGFNAGYEWDQSVFGSGIYVNYVSFSKEAEKFSVTGGFYYPRIETGFPLYLRANIGLGQYNTEDADQKGATFDYNASLGLRFFTDKAWMFNLEIGSRNHTRLLKSASAQSIVVGSGLAITF